MSPLASFGKPSLLPHASDAPEPDYDLVAIGTGTAAKKVALACRKAGWRVAVVDHRPYGGTCALRGCDPKKAMWSVAEACDRARRLGSAGIRGTDELALDWSGLMAFKHQFTDLVPEKRESLFRDAGIDRFHGRARFVGPNSIAVGEDRLEARHMLIAAGAEPARLPFPGAEHLITSDEYLEMDELPSRFVLVGGGYIAFEFAHTAVRLGAKPLIIEAERPLASFDEDLVDRLVAKSRRLGIEVHTQTKVVGVERPGDRLFRVHARTDAGEPLCFEAEIAVAAAGRVPALDALDLDAGNVSRKGAFLQLNPHLQSVTNPAVFAAGDAASLGPALTPVASHDAEIVIANLLGNGPPTHVPDYTGVPSVAFTIPPITGVGFTEEQARAQGLRFRVNHRDITDWQVTRHLGEDTAAYKVLIEDDSDRILGAHLIGPDAEHLINMFALAIRLGLTARDLNRFVSAFPTAASNIFHMIGTHRSGDADGSSAAAQPMGRVAAAASSSRAWVMD